MKNKSIGIIGLGAEIPKKTLSNFDLEKIVDTTDEWIKTRSGISSRHVIGDNENISDIAAAAGLKAIADAGLESSDIDLIMMATGSPEMIWPSTACLAQAKMGMKNQPAFDLQAACSGFSYGLSLARQMIFAGEYRNILLIGAEAMTRFLDWNDRSTCVLFGDAAAAAVIGHVDDGYGLLADYMGADGRGADMLKIPVGGSGIARGQVRGGSAQVIVMNGREVFKFAVKIIDECVESVMAKAGMELEEIDFLIPHQANIRITERAVEKLGLAQEKVVNNIENYGNTGAASIPLALTEVYESGKLRKGNIVVLVAFGAGLTWGANVIKWSKNS